MSGLYIHIPFCKGKCPYCAFMSVVPDGETPIKQYFDALITDLLSTGKTEFDTLYIGGGTPSSVPNAILDEFFNRLFSVIKVRSEFTVEANPESLNADFLKIIGIYGANRLSMGCQSTDDDVLNILGRLHNRKGIFTAYDTARRYLPNADINLDMIFDIPTAPVEAAVKTMNEICALKPEHISAYSYSFDTGYLRENGETEESAFTEVKEFLQKSGYNKYEISNFAIKGHESKHNINYWKMGDFLGIGASAWSLENFPDKRILKGKTKDLNIYINNPIIYEETAVTEQCELIKESVVFGLRMAEGVDVKALSDFYNYVDYDLGEKIGRMCAEELLLWKNGKIALTERGELLADSVSEFLW